MSWFDRHRGDEAPEAAWRHLSDLVAGSGVGDVLERACGRRGLRRFVVRFEVRGPRVRVDPVDSAPLADGGGPPPSFDPVAFEAAVARFQARLPPPWTFRRGAFGVVRDADGTLDLVARFDEDADAFRLAELRAPRGDAHPLDHPAWLKAVGDWSARMAALRWLVPGESWSWEGALEVDGNAVAAELLGVWRSGRFAWWLDEPAGDEGPLCEPELEVTLAEAAEVVALAAAKRGHAGVFRGVTEDGATVFGGLR